MAFPLRKPLALLLLIFTQTDYNATAQTVNGLIPARVPDSRPEATRAAYELYKKTHSGNALKPTGSSERLTGIYMSRYNASGNMSREDSAAYRYSGTRGANPNGQTMYINALRMDMLFDTGVSYLWTGVQGSYSPQTRVLKSFDAQDRPASYIHQNRNGASWENNQKGTYTYTPTGKERMTDVFTWDISAAAWSPSNRHQYTYNSSGDILSDTFQTWNFSTNALALFGRTLYTYDASGRLILMTWQTWTATTSSWELMNKDSIAYTASGKFSSWTSWYRDAGTGNLTNGFRDFSFYNSADVEIATLTQVDDLSGGWQSVDSTLHALLDPAGLPLVDSSYENIGAGWQLAERTTNTYTAGNLLNTSLTEKFTGGTFENESRDFYFYDSYGQLTRHYVQSWDGSSWSLASTGEQRYYYEPYTTVGIETATTATAIQGSLYPVPARHQATLALNLQTQQKLQISVFDLTGKLHLRWNDEAHAGLYTKNFSVTALPAGTYCLRVDAGQSNWTGIFNVLY